MKVLGKMEEDMVMVNLEEKMVIVMQVGDFTTIFMGMEWKLMIRVIFMMEILVWIETGVC